jgi:hypothetical protein
MGMTISKPNSLVARLSWLVLLCGIAGPGLGQGKAPAPPTHTPLHFADYDSEPRRPDGHVDGDALLARLKELNVTTYYWLVWHAATDWDDLKLFLPKAALANLQVWVYLVPPTESAPQGAMSIPSRFGSTTAAGRRKSPASRYSTPT